VGYGKMVGVMRENDLPWLLCRFTYGRTRGQIKLLSKSDGKCPIEVGGHISRARGHNKYYSGNGDAVFLLDGGAMWQRLQRWWGNKKVLVLKVHMV